LISEELQGMNITVTAKVTDISELCSVSDVFPVAPIMAEDPLDQAGRITPAEYMARVDNMLLALKEDPPSFGLIDLVFAKSAPRSRKVSILNAIRKIVQLRRFDPTRISIAVSEAETEISTFWLVPPGARLPRTLPKNAKIYKLSELSKSQESIILRNN